MRYRRTGLAWWLAAQGPVAFRVHLRHRKVKNMGACCSAEAEDAGRRAADPQASAWAALIPEPCWDGGSNSSGGNVLRSQGGLVSPAAAAAQTRSGLEPLLCRVHVLITTA